MYKCYKNKPLTTCRYILYIYMYICFLATNLLRIIVPLGIRGCKNRTSCFELANHSSLKIKKIKKQAKPTLHHYSLFQP